MSQLEGKSAATPTHHERDFWRLARVASSLAIGGMAAFIASIRGVTPQFVLEFSALTVVGFILGAIAAWMFWSLLPQEDADGKPIKSLARNRWLLVVSLFMGVGTIAGFVLNMKGIEKSKMVDMAEGTFFALIALSIVGFAFWQAVRFLEQDRRENTHEGNSPAPGSDSPDKSGRN